LGGILDLSYYVVRLGSSGEGRDKDPLRVVGSKNRGLEGTLGDHQGDRHGVTSYMFFFFFGKRFFGRDKLMGWLLFFGGIANVGGGR
jgi:hypothetical protein